MFKSWCIWEVIDLRIHTKINGSEIVRGPQAAKCWNAIFIFKRKIKNKDGLQHFADWVAFGAIDNLFDGAKKSFGPVSREDASREGAKRLFEPVVRLKIYHLIKNLVSF